MARRSSVGGTAALPPYRAQLARLVKQPPAGDEWLHEMKYDGYRIGCRIENGRVTLISRNGKDWTESFPEIAAAAADLGTRKALLDGEVAIVLPDGRTSFQALQNAFSGGSRRGLVYFVFDLLHLEGANLQQTALDERKDELLRLVGRPTARGRIRYSEYVAGQGDRMFAEACRLGLEGIISKRRDAPYKPGRAETWLKTKCVNRQEFVIGGFTDPEGSRQGIGALLVGFHEPDGRLTFGGKVGTGFTAAIARGLRKRLEQLEQRDCPFDPPPKGWLGKNAHWVKPRLVAEVVFTEWTEEGKIRHPSFQGLRADKRPREVTRERAANAPPPAAASAARNFPRAGAASAARNVGSASGGAVSRGPASRSAEVLGVRISHPDRVLYPQEGITKLALARFYERIAGWMVPHLEARPLTLVRCPEGLRKQCFYMKHSKVWAPPALRRVLIPEKTKIGEYLVVDDVAALISLVQMDVLEIHTWNSRVETVELPNRIVFDIDPGAQVSWARVVETARLVRQMLESVGLESFAKTTGGKGLHVVVPLAPRADWRACLEFSRAFAEAIARHDPGLYTTAFAKAGREKKILIDYLRNNRTNTSVAAFSTRARERAPVSMPVRWDEVTTALRPAAWTVLTVERRLTRLRHDPWAGYWKTRQRLAPKAAAALQRL